MKQPGEQTELQVGLAEITEPAMVDGERREVSIGHHIVVKLGDETGILTADVADAVADRLQMLAKEARRIGAAAS